MYKINEDRLSSKQTFILNGGSKLSEQRKGMPFTVCASALVISALIYPRASVHAWGQAIILIWSQNMQSVPQK